MGLIEQFLSFGPASIRGKFSATKIHSSELLPRQATWQKPGSYSKKSKAIGEQRPCLSQVSWQSLAIDIHRSRPDTIQSSQL